MKFVFIKLIKYMSKLTKVYMYFLQTLNLKYIRNVCNNLSYELY